MTWVGDPDCDAAHGYLLHRLQDHSTGFHESTSTVTSNVHGNIGEFITCCVGEDHAFAAYADHRVFGANADQPLGRLAKPQIDLVWLLLGSDQANDRALVQEVKTTCAERLTYAKALVADYAKLFGPQLRFTLQSRLQTIASECRRKLRRPDLSPRVRALAGTSPQTSPSIRLIPTLVHDLAAEPPGPPLVSVRQTLLLGGWSASQVTAWAIGLTDLESRLNRLACGE